MNARTPDFDVPEFVLTNISLRGETIVQVCCGVEHYAIVCSSGRVFTYGDNTHNQLGLSEGGAFVSEPTLVAALGFLRIIQVACGRDFTLFLAEGGRLLGCGSNDRVHGASTGDDGPTPITLTGEVSVAKIAAGLGHALVLTTSGAIMSSGENSAGQLGIKKAENLVHLFTTVDHYRVFTDMSCGAYHSAMLQNDGTLHTAGWNGEGQLGSGHDAMQKGLQLVHLPTGVKAIACGFEHTAAIGTDGTVWAWGRNDRGQLGVGDRLERSKPGRVLGTEGREIANVIAGRNFTGLVAKGGEVSMCGSRGAGVDADLLVPTSVGRFPDLTERRVDCALAYSPTLLKPVYGDCAKDAASKVLECPVCFVTLSARIRVCRWGHGVCEDCGFHMEDCPLCREPFGPSERPSLPASLHKCPLRKSCGWTGPMDHVMNHALSAHPRLVWSRLPLAFVQDCLDDLVECNPISAHGRAFLLLRRYDATTHVFFASLLMLGRAMDVGNFTFRLEVTTQDCTTRITFDRNVCVATKSAFVSGEGVSMEGKMLDAFLQGNQLSCEVSVLNVVARVDKDCQDMNE